MPTIEWEARRRRAWVPVPEFLNAVAPIRGYEDDENSHGRHTTNVEKSQSSDWFVTRLVRWSWAKVYSTTPSSIAAGTPPSRMSGTTYVLVSNVRQLARAVEAARRGSGEASSPRDGVSSGTYSDAITTRTLFRAWIVRELGIHLSEDDTTLLITTLAREDGVLRHRDSVLKFISESDRLDSVDVDADAESPEQGITDSDLAVASLKSTMAQLQSHVATLERTIEDAQASLKVQVRAASASSSSASSKVSALATLRRLKRTEERLRETLQRHAECSTLLDRIDDGMNQVRVVHGMERASAALATVLRQIGGVERVESIVDKVREQSDQVEEIRQVMASTALHDRTTPGDAQEEEEDNVDAALQEEFEALLKSSQAPPISNASPLSDEPDSARSKQAENHNEHHKQVAETTTPKREAILA